VAKEANASTDRSLDRVFSGDQDERVSRFLSRLPRSRQGEDTPIHATESYKAFTACWPLGSRRKVGIQINLIGTFRCIAKSAAGMLALPPLAGGERGVIVNTASVTAKDGQIGQAASSASKALVAPGLPACSAASTQPRMAAQVRPRTERQRAILARSQEQFSRSSDLPGR
jgi:hypothetical protein